MTLAVRYRSTQLVMLAVLTAIGLALGVAVAHSPVITAVVVGAAAVGAVMISQPLLATLVLVVSFYFQGYLNSGSGIVTPEKLIGAAAVAAWLIDCVIRRRPLRATAHLIPLTAFALWLIPSFVASHERRDAAVYGTRYLTFFILFFVVYQIVAVSERRLYLVVDAAIAASAVSALIGLIGFSSGNVGRASGPLAGANDYAFVLASTLPLAIWRIVHSRSLILRLAAAAATIALALAVAASLSRGAAVGLAVAGLWAVVTGRVRLRWVGVALAVLAIGGATVLIVAQETVNSAVKRKEHVATQNVQSRFYYWGVAEKEFLIAPITGVGPGNFGPRLTDFSLQFYADKTTPTTHEVYLNILAEMGLPGLIFFLSYLVIAWKYIRRKPEGDRKRIDLQTAIGAGFFMAVVGSFFLTEQYFPPLWLLGALGASQAGFALAEPARVRNFRLRNAAPPDPAPVATPS